MQTSLTASFKVVVGLAGIYHAVVLNVRTFCIYCLGIRCYDISTDVAGETDDALVRVHSILEILRCIIILAEVGVVSFFQLNDVLEQWVTEMELHLRII